MTRKSLSEEPLRLPIKIDPTTNGEFFPEPLSRRLRWICRLALDRCENNARQLGLSRREFLKTTCGAATVLLALNETACGGGSYSLPKEAPLDPAASSAALDGDEFIFDVQTHHVSTERPWWNVKRPSMAGFLKKSPQARCGKAHFSECFSRDVFVKEVFLDSDTDLAVMSALWGTDEMNPILVEEMAATRESMEKLDGAPRLRIHGVVRPKSDSKQASSERMQAMAEDLKISAWKLYPVWSTDGRGYRLDDPETGAWVIERGLALGIPLFAIHKGLPLPGAANAFTSPIDVGPAAKAFPRATLLIYHSGYDASRREGPYDAKADKGVDALIRSLAENGIGKDGNVYAELGSTWRHLMKDPDQAAHLLGKLLVHLGPDRILWGTDAIWYGSPQDQIQAFRAFQISKRYQEQYGYPELTPAIKAKIFGLNAARVYGVDVAELRRAQRWDPIAQARDEYRDAPDPTFCTYGPRTRREMLGLLRAERG